MVVAVDVILTAAGVGEVTAIVMPFDVAGFPRTFARLEVITQVTTCPLVNVVVEKVLLFVPAFAPFTFH